MFVEKSSLSFLSFILKQYTNLMKKKVLIVLVFSCMLSVGVYLKYHSDTHKSAILPITSKEVRAGSSTSQSNATTSSHKLPQPIKDTAQTKESISSEHKYRPLGKLSPVDLIVIDPQEYTITPTTSVQTDEEINTEVSGELYYSHSPNAEVSSPKLKFGDYIVIPVRKPDAPDGSIYSITITMQGFGELTVVTDAPVEDIPKDGYRIRVTPSEAIIFTPSSTTSFPVTKSSTLSRPSGKYRSCNNPEEKLHYGSARVSMEVKMENVGGDLMVTDPDGYSVPNWHQTSEEILNEVPGELYMGIPFDVDSKWRPMWDVYSPKIKTGIYTVRISPWKDISYNSGEQLTIKFLTLNGCILVVDNELVNDLSQEGRVYQVTVPDDISGPDLSETN